MAAGERRPTQEDGRIHTSAHLGLFSVRRECRA